MEDEIIHWLQSLPKNTRDQTSEHVERAMRHVRQVSRLTSMMNQLTHRQTTSGGTVGVGIGDLGSRYGVLLTTDATHCITSGIKAAFANFVDLLIETLSLAETSDTSGIYIEKIDARLQNTRQAAVEMLWGALDDGHVDAECVSARAVAAVDNLWNIHAVKSIHAERENLRVMHSHFVVLSEFSGYVKNLNVRYDELAHPPRASRKVISAVYTILSRIPHALLGIREIPRSHEDVEKWIVTNATNLHEACTREALRLKSLLYMDTQHPAWASLEVRTGLLANERTIQGPATHSPILTSSGKRVAVVSTHGMRVAIPTVRLCHALRVLIHRRWLRLDELDITYLLRIVEADRVRLNTSINAIVEHELLPTGSRTGVPFSRHWVDPKPVSLPLLPDVFPTRVEDTPIPELAATAPTPDWVAADVSLRDRLEDETTIFIRLKEKLRVVPEDLEFDYTTLSVLMIALDGSSARCSRFSLDGRTITARVAATLSNCPLSDNGVLQKVCMVFKQLVTNCRRHGIRCYYDRQEANRKRELVFERTHCGVSIVHTTCLVISQILRGMEADGIWPEGVSWNRVSRHRVRNRRSKLDI